MSDTVKVVIEIPKEEYEYIKALSDVVIDSNTYSFLIKNGTLLDDVKAEIEKLNPVDYGSMFSYESHNGAKDMQIDVLQILDNIGKEREEKVNGKNE